MGILKCHENQDPEKRRILQKSREALANHQDLIRNLKRVEKVLPMPDMQGDPISLNLRARDGEMQHMPMKLKAVNVSG